MIISVAQYREETGDLVTPEAKVRAALIGAQRRVEEYVGREFDYGERTETLAVDSTGRARRVWPLGYPIHAVSAPTGAVAYASHIESLPAGSSVTVTYAAGFDADHGPVPSSLADIIVEVAERRITPANTTAVPAGTTAVQVDGQGFSGGMLGGRAALPSAVKAQLRPWRHFDQRRGDDG